MNLADWITSPTLGTSLTGFQRLHAILLGPFSYLKNDLTEDKIGK